MTTFTFVPKQFISFEKISKICSEKELEEITKKNKMKGYALRLAVSKKTGLVTSFEQAKVYKKENSNFDPDLFMGRDVVDFDEDTILVNGTVVIHNYSDDPLMGIFFKRFKDDATLSDFEGTYLENYAIKSDFISLGEDMLVDDYEIGAAIATVDIATQKVIRVEKRSSVVIGKQYKSKKGTIKVSCNLANRGCCFGGVYF